MVALVPRRGRGIGAADQWPTDPQDPLNYTRSGLEVRFRPHDRKRLLIRRNIANGDLAVFSTWCPKDTPMKKLVSVEGHRWAIEDSFETAKNELGLDHNETRS